MTGRMRTGHSSSSQLLSNVTWGLRITFRFRRIVHSVMREWDGQRTQVFVTALYLLQMPMPFSKYLLICTRSSSWTERFGCNSIRRNSLHIFGMGDCFHALFLDLLSSGDRSIMNQYESMKAWVNSPYDGDDFRWRTAQLWRLLALDTIDLFWHAIGATNERVYLKYLASAEFGKYQILEETGRCKRSSWNYRNINQCGSKRYYSPTGRYIQTQTAMIYCKTHHLSDNEKLIKDTLWDLFTTSTSNWTVLQGLRCWDVCGRHGFADLELLLYEDIRAGWMRLGRSSDGLRTWVSWVMGESLEQIWTQWSLFLWFHCIVNVSACCRYCSIGGS